MADETMTRGDRMADGPMAGVVFCCLMIVMTLATSDLLSRPFTRNYGTNDVDFKGGSQKKLLMIYVGVALCVMYLVWTD